MRRQGRGIARSARRATGRLVIAAVGLLSGVAVTVVPDPTAAPAAVTDTSLMFVTTEPGALVGGGATFQQASVTYQRPATDRHRFVSVGDHTVIVEVRAASGALATGDYRDLREPDAAEAKPGLRLTIDGVTCPTFGGGMTVDEIAFDATGNVTNFALRFSSRCTGETLDSAGGTVAYHATVPVYAGTWTQMSATTNIAFGATDMVTFEFANTGPSPMTVQTSGMSYQRTTSGFFPSLQYSPIGGCVGVIVPGQRCAIGIPIAGDAVGSGVFRVALYTELFPLATGPTPTPLTVIGPEVSITGVSSPAGPIVGVIAADGERDASELPGGHLVARDAINLPFSQNLRARPGSSEWTAGFFFPSTPIVGQAITQPAGGGPGPGSTFYLTGATHCPTASATNTFIVDEYTPPPTGSSIAAKLSGRFVQSCGTGPGHQLFGSITFPAANPAYSHAISPSALGFGAVAPATIATPQSVTIRNDGTKALTISSISLVGADRGEFTIITNACPVSLAAGAACTVTVAFAPTTTGSKSAQLRVVDSLTDFAGDGRGQDVLLTGGTGDVVNPPPTTVPPTLPPTSTNPTTTTTIPTTTTTLPPSTPPSTTTTTTTTIAPAGGSSAGDVPSGFVPVPSRRVYDTRDGTGGAGGRLGAFKRRTFDIAAAAGLPDTAWAVAVNVTATRSDGNGYLVVYPGDELPPDSSNLNFGAGRDAANLVIVALGEDGTIGLASGTSTTDVIVDLVGWYGEAAGGAAPLGQHAVDPFRAVDTRQGAPLLGGTTRRVKLAGDHGVPADARAVVVNLTATNVTTSTFLTLFPAGTALPGTSTLNVDAGDTRPNLAIVELARDGTAEVYLDRGRADVLIDVVGYFTSKPAGDFLGITPTRAYDSRWPGERPFESGDVVVLEFPTEIFDLKVTAVVLNVTVTDTTVPVGDGYLSVFPDDATSLPEVSNLNFGSGDVIANLVVVKVPADGGVVFYDYGGRANVIVDVMGVVLE